MRPIAILGASALPFSGSGIAAAANSTRIAEAGAFLLVNAHRCGVADERVVRAGKLIGDLIAAASNDAGEQIAAKSRFVEIFRASDRPEGDVRVPIPPCMTVVTQFERLEHFSRPNSGEINFPQRLLGAHRHP